MKVHVAGLSCGLDAVANRESAAGAMAVAAAAGSDLVVLPEYASRFDPGGVGPGDAEPLDGPFVASLREAARSHGVAVIAGTTLPGRRRAVNAVVVIDGSGAVAGVYRKVHLFDAFGQRESERLEPGPADAPPVVLEVAGMVVGVMTCYDLRFPESARRLVDAGAQVLAVPAAWASGDHKADHWSTLLRARAIENTAYVLGAAMQGPAVAGDALVVDPEGVILAHARGGGQAMAAAELRPEAVERARELNPVLRNRRYGVVPL